MRQDKQVAEALKPQYMIGCKRPTSHAGFLPVFNQPNVTLVDTQGKGIDEITAKGVRFAGVEYELDVLILATGGCHWLAKGSATCSPARFLACLRNAVFLLGAA
jgi:cation diffusion facilitator CzcD-associated flavoprotein CzcO